jgi:Sugar phosphate isomerases/epimerases
MEMSTSIELFRNIRNSNQYRTSIECIERCKKAGFRHLDFSFASSKKKGNEIFLENWEQTINEVKEQTDKLGMIIDQTHAPFTIKEYDLTQYKELMRRALIASSLLGAKQMVIHADVYDKGESDYNETDALNAAYEFYAPYVELAKKHNIKLAVENLFEEKKDGKRSRFTSTVEEQLAVIQKFDDPSVGACWDSGHARVVYGDNIIEPLKKIGKYLIATHIHDNYAGMDLHVPVYFGFINWPDVMNCLNEIKYKGNFTYEYVYVVFPDELADAYIKLFYDTGIKLIHS